MDHARRLGALYEQKEDFANAIAWYEYAAQLTNQSDAGLVRKVSDLKMKRSERRDRATRSIFSGARPGQRVVCRNGSGPGAKRRRSARPSSLKTRKSAWTAIRPICNCVLNWANIC